VWGIVEMPEGGRKQTGEERRKENERKGGVRIERITLRRVC